MGAGGGGTGLGTIGTGRYGTIGHGSGTGSGYGIGSGAGGMRGRIGIAWRSLWAPVGLRFHALHHWIPSLPYHNLGRAHRLLLTTLATDAPYVETQHPAIAPLVVDLGGGVSCRLPLAVAVDANGKTLPVPTAVPAPERRPGFVASGRVSRACLEGF